MMNMGEAKRRHLTHAKLLVSEPRCIYCFTTGPLTIEHMPGRAMFRGKERPNQMEFVACATCNRGSSGADALAAFLCRLQQEELSLSDWQMKEARKYLQAARTLALPAVAELFDPSKTTDQQIWTKHGSLQPSKGIKADGPALHAFMSVFAAKLGMALFREHVGHALPEGGTVWSQFYLNAGMNKQIMESTLAIMPMFQILRQAARLLADNLATDSTATINQSSLPSLRFIKTYGSSTLLLRCPKWLS